MNYDPSGQTNSTETGGEQKKFCPRCGKELPANAQFCGECGFRFSSEGQGFPFTVPEQPMMMADTTPLKTTDYLVLILLSSIPVVGLILLLVWALSTTENVNRRNFCRAQLIWMGISVVVSILFMIVYGIIFAAAFESIGTSNVFSDSILGMILR